MRGGGMGGGGGMRGGGMGGAAARGGAGGGAAARVPGAPRPGAAAPGGEKALTLQNLRVVLFTDQGVLVADPVPVGLQGKDKRGWLPVSVPIIQFKGAQGAKSINAVGLFADESDTFYLGQIRLVVDRTPPELKLAATPQIARTKQVVSFSAELLGGAMDPLYTWDFGESDRAQQQAVGRKVKYIFKDPGDYVVTCTATDRGGVRQPVAKTTGVHVEEPPK